MISEYSSLQALHGGDDDDESSDEDGNGLSHSPSRSGDRHSSTIMPKTSEPAVVEPFAWSQDTQDLTLSGDSVARSHRIKPNSDWREDNGIEAAVDPRAARLSRGNRAHMAPPSATLPNNERSLEVRLPSPLKCVSSPVFTKIPSIHVNQVLACMEPYSTDVLGAEQASHIKVRALTSDTRIPRHLF